MRRAPIALVLCALTSVRAQPIVPALAPGGVPAAETSTIYHFKHVQTGARRLRGGAFPGDILLYPDKPALLLKSPAALGRPRFGIVRIPSLLLDAPALEGEAGKEKGTTTTLEPRAAAIDDVPGDAPLRFWIDLDGDGDLTDEAITPAEGEPTPKLDPRVTSMLERRSHGTLKIGSRDHNYLAGRPIGSDSVLILIANEDGAAWDKALGLLFEGPPWIEHPPSGLTAPRCGTVRLGVREKPERYVAILDFPPPRPDAPPRLFIDSNADGLFKEPPIPFEKSPSPQGLKASSDIDNHWMCKATIELHYPAVPDTTAATVLLADLALDLRMVGEQPALTFRAEWGRTGTICLEGKDHAALLFDDLGSGDYRGSTGGNDSGVRLLIDLDDSGKFDRGEAFDPSKKFVVLGSEYKVEDVSPSGDTFRLVTVAPATRPSKP